MKKDLITSFMDTAKVTINQQLNHEWIKGISSSGNVDEVKLINIYPFSRHLVIRSNCTGNLSVKVESAAFSL